MSVRWYHRRWFYMWRQWCNLVWRVNGPRRVDTGTDWSDYYGEWSE